MKPAQRLTAIIEREDDGFVALCPDLDIASEGASIEEARANLIEAIAVLRDGVLVRSRPALSPRGLRDPG